jgi:hypothetical protein
MILAFSLFTCLLAGAVQYPGGSQVAPMAPPSQAPSNQAPSSPGTSSQGTNTAPTTTAPPSSQDNDVCKTLKNPEHIKIAQLLSGNEKILFCSIFDDTQRDQVLAYLKKNPSMKPKDAVIQVGKDNDLLFSSKPGGACGAH